MSQQKNFLPLRPVPATILLFTKSIFKCCMYRHGFLWVNNWNYSNGSPFCGYSLVGGGFWVCFCLTFPCFFLKGSLPYFVFIAWIYLCLFEKRKRKKKTTNGSQYLITTQSWMNTSLLCRTTFKKLLSTW